MSGVEPRVDRLEAVFAPEVFTELDLGGGASRRLVVGSGCLFGGRFEAAGCQGFRAHVGLALPQLWQPLNPQLQLHCDGGRYLRGIITLQAVGIDGGGGEIMVAPSTRLEMDTEVLVPNETTLVYAALATP